MAPWHRPRPKMATAMSNRAAPRPLPKQQARDIPYLGHGQKPCAPKMPRRNPLLPPPPHRRLRRRPLSLRRDSTCPQYCCLPRPPNRLPYIRFTSWETTRDRGLLHTPCRASTTLLRCWGGGEALQFRHHRYLCQGIATSTGLATATSAR